MIANKNPLPVAEYSVTHPMFDVPEAKCDGKELGLMKISTSARFCLILLRAYLIGIGLLFAYHMLDMAGVIHHIK